MVLFPMILVLQDVSPKISRLLSFHWNFFPILFSLPSSLIFNILCLFIAIWIIFHLIISTLVSFKWLLKSQMIVYVSFPVNESFQTSSVKSSVCSNVTQLGLRRIPGPLNWYLWEGSDGICSRILRSLPWSYQIQKRPWLWETELKDLWLDTSY